MKFELIYPHIVKTCPESPHDATFYQPYHERFAKTYRQFPAGFPHRLRVIFCGGPPDDKALSLYEGLPNLAYGNYDGLGWDIGCHQEIVSRLNCDMAMCFVTPTHFREPDWLKPIAFAAIEHGVGLYGTSASYQNMPHIRCGAFAFPPRLMRLYPWLIDSRELTAYFESGFFATGSRPEMNFSEIAANLNYPVKMVTRLGVFGKSEWRAPEDIFRRGDQSNALVWDRHFDIYEAASDEEKRVLEGLADTVTYPSPVQQTSLTNEQV